MPENCAAIVIAAKHHELSKIKDTRGTTNTVGALRCKFQFRTDDWINSAKTAMFCNGDALLHPEVGDDAIKVPLDADDECPVPLEVLTDTLPYSIGVWGVTDKGLRIVSNWLVFNTQNGCYTEGNAPADPTPTEYEQILTISKNAVDAANAVVERANRGEFKGEDGYTPVKGIDYFDGVDGKDGKDGVDGLPGRDGKDGAPGKDGLPGKDGADGKEGPRGQDGADGKDGVGIEDIHFNADNEMVISMTDSSTKNLGKIPSEGGSSSAIIDIEKTEELVPHSIEGNTDAGGWLYGILALKHSGLYTFHPIYDKNYEAPTLEMSINGGLFDEDWFYIQNDVPIELNAGIYGLGIIFEPNKTIKIEYEDIKTTIVLPDKDAVKSDVFYRINNKKQERIFSVDDYAAVNSFYDWTSNLYKPCNIVPVDRFENIPKIPTPMFTMNNGECTEATVYFVKEEEAAYVYVTKEVVEFIIEGPAPDDFVESVVSYPCLICNSLDELDDWNNWIENPLAIGIVHEPGEEEIKLYHYVPDRWIEVDGEDNAIVDVSSLPTAEINKNIFYRLVKETPSDFYIMLEGERLSDEQVEELGMNAIIVDVLPENPTTLDAETGKINAYIRSDLTGWIYIEEGFSEEQELGLEAGWYSFEQVGQQDKIVSSPEEAQDAEPGILYFVYEVGGYEYKLYYYNDEWVEVGGGIDTSIIPTKLSELENDSQYIAKPELEQEYVKKTDYAVTDGEYGLVKLADPNISGIGRDMGGRLVTFYANETDIDSKETSRKPITPYELDYAIKVGMTTNTKTWSEDDKTKARELIGAVGFTNYADQDKAGVVKLKNADGFRIVKGYLNNPYALKNDFINKTTAHFLRPEHAPLIAKYGIVRASTEATADNGYGLDADEKASAQKWLGVPTTYDELKDKPFLEYPTINIHYNGIPTELYGRLYPYEDSYGYSAGVRYVDTNTYTRSQLIDAVGTYDMSYNPRVRTKIITDDDIIEETSDGLCIALSSGGDMAAIFVAYTDKYKPKIFSETLPRAGIYFTHMSDCDHPYVESLTHGGVKYLDNKYLDLANNDTIKTLDTKIGDIETALDGILALQNTYLGGES